ncbi:MAG: hypothetical protein IPG22_06610 [Acidobacteria bacterium]|nr:hypothetical protein [Acidobacteriota bacterium]
MTNKLQKYYTLPKLFNWHLAKMRIAFVNFATIPIRFSTDVFKAMAEKDRPQ